MERCIAGAKENGVGLSDAILEDTIGIAKDNIMTTEELAMIGDRMAILRLVSAVRQYRDAVKNLLSSRYSDGECDAVGITTFEVTCKEIENSLEEEA